MLNKYCLTTKRIFKEGFHINNRDAKSEMNILYNN